MTSDVSPPDSVRSPRMRQWALLLGGPLIWAAHFFAVYLLTEAACGRGTGDRFDPGLVSGSVLVLTAAAIAGGTWIALRGVLGVRHTGGGDEIDGFFAWMTAALGLVFVVSVGFVGVPAAVLPTC